MMPTKRTKRIIPRKKLPTAAQAWARGEYALAVALDEWEEFKHFDHYLTDRERAAAEQLRREIDSGTPRDHARIAAEYAHAVIAAAGEPNPDK
jgi:hypothetical protein